MQDKILRAAQAIRQNLGEAETAIVLGSGLGDFADQLEDAKSMSYTRIPDFARTTVQGHSGRMFMGGLEGRPVLVLRGRFHYYEGYDATEVTLPVRALCALGVKTLILTNAAGAVNKSFAPGDLMLIDDFLNLSGVNPLRGPNMDDMGPRFPDMSQAMDPALGRLALDTAKQQGLHLQRGVYAQLQGPTYETPAEIRMLRILGADAVGMSTVPEVIVARHCGMRVLGLSCITNMAAGILPQPLSHDEVVQVGQQVKGTFTNLLKGVVAGMADA